MNEYDNQKEITLEVRYHRPGAMLVDLVWGIDGWQALPAEKQPPGTVLADQGKMKSPMVLEGDRFVIRLQLPAGAQLNYAFLAANPGTPDRWEILTSQDNIVDISLPDIRLKRKQERVYNYTRFILIGQARSGSTFLMALLDSHPAIKGFGELFHKELQQRVWQSKNAPAIDQDDDPVEYLENNIFTVYPSHIQVVGFKLFSYHAIAGRWQKVWSYLQHPELKVIHLTRWNLLNQYLSLKLADRSSVWGIQKQQPDESLARPLKK